MRVHVLGNVLGPIFVYATSLISVCMILAAGLSFLGLGTKPPEPEWGLMLNTLRTAIYLNPVGRGAAGRDDLHRVDLLQPFERRPAERDGCPSLRRSHRSPIVGGPQQPLLEVRGLSKHFAVGGGLFGRGGGVVRAVDDVTFTVEQGRGASASSGNPAAASRPPRG